MRARKGMGLTGLALAVVVLTGAGPGEDAALLDAARRGDVAAARTALRAGANANAARGDGLSALHLAAEQGSVEVARLLIDAKANVEAKSRIGGVSLECAASHVPISLIGLLEGKDILLGAIDVATDTVETPEAVAAVIRAGLAHVPAARVFPCTNCGMVPLDRAVAQGKLRALAAGAAIVRKELGERR